MDPHKLSKKAREYKPQAISTDYCNNILVEMILNNMKIEGQEVPKAQYLTFREEMQAKQIDKQ